MKKALKCALEKEQIEYKNSLDFIDGYEIHLYGDIIKSPCFQGNLFLLPSSAESRRQGDYWDDEPLKE